MRLSEALWDIEERTGIERDPQTRTVKEGALFQVTHVRPAPGSGSELVMFATGDRPSWQAACGMVPLGAGAPRTRDALRRRRRRAATIAERPRGGGASGRALLALLTPALLSAEQWCGAAPLVELGGTRLVCAVGPRPVRLGDWDGRSASPVAQQSYVAPSSVLFVEHGDGGALAGALRAFGDVPQIGSRTSAGYGVALVGPWPKGSS